MDEKIKQLENRIRELENPFNINPRLREILISEGFIKVDKILDFQLMAGVTFLTLIARVLDNDLVINAQPGSYYKEFTVDISNDTLNSKGHGLSSSNQILLKSTGTLPGGIDETISYYVVEETEDTFKISLTYEGSPINITNSGIGTHYWEFFT